MKKKVELLSPAGNMKCLKAAVSAGADAVYVGGDRFGARAYADNFQTQELCEAIDYVHLFGKKLYLTLNTLLKDKELKQIPDYVRPFYESGLDGVIVQDFGVVRVLKEYFDGLELHASTQMTVTGSFGAKLLKEMGICRVVPARELSLKEIVKIKEEADVEIETFIHGAMCYCYSGQCLLSSFLGGRSGNRGRCAGPCRLPYQVTASTKIVNEKKEQYPISLKDLGALPILSKLMQSGIDSFKIEGRMKSPEYVAGVTSIYRKYMDRFYENPALFQIDNEDLDLLRRLYTRGGLETGYYEQHNGRNMVTLTKGTYENAASDVSALMKERFVDTDPKLPVAAKADLFIGRPAELTLRVMNRRVCDRQSEEQKEEDTISVLAKSAGMVLKAQNRPMSREDVQKQLSKMGNTAFRISEITILQDADIFLPNKELNELRRSAAHLLLQQILTPYRRRYREKEAAVKAELPENKSGTRLTVSVSSMEQLAAVLSLFDQIPIERLYLPYRLLREWYRQNPEEALDILKNKISCFVSFPSIVREKERKEMERFFRTFCNLPVWDVMDGFLTGSLEAYACLRELLKEQETGEKTAKRFMADYNLYAFNSEAAAFLHAIGLDHMTAPLEWSKFEFHDFADIHKRSLPELVVYGYLPLMETAGCIYKTMKHCRKDEASPEYFLTDRYNKHFPILADCEFCTNTILNSVPLSLHKEWTEIKKLGDLCLRLRFTMEDRQQTCHVITQFGKLLSGRKECDLPDEHTTGHFRKGVL